MKRLNIRSNTKWEDLISYSRAVRSGNHIEVSGTTAVDGDKIIGRGDPSAQAVFIFNKIGKALQDAGAEMKHVVRTRIFLRNISDWEAVGKIYAEVFRDINPAASMIEVGGFIHPDMLMEIEVTAITES
ncbi:MAG: RidA family protein [Bacteroidetes bacterium]|nr:MAG: RidA family protein [Bacteroidota bacterium]REK00020.1 MAG: RidA family protein [Bacteroidota bacterium]REK35800.1 MAG: RidA family protein [Bacteroidota bacterium]REK49328.1 MAG: RidA family protein [Bacteroidota bacterium]